MLLPPSSFSSAKKRKEGRKGKMKTNNINISMIAIECLSSGKLTAAARQAALRISGASSLRNHEARELRDIIVAEALRISALRAQRRAAIIPPQPSLLERWAASPRGQAATNMIERILSHRHMLGAHQITSIEFTAGAEAYASCTTRTIWPYRGQHRRRCATHYRYRIGIAPAQFRRLLSLGLLGAEQTLMLQIGDLELRDECDDLLIYMASATWIGQPPRSRLIEAVRGYVAIAYHPSGGAPILVRHSADSAEDALERLRRGLRGTDMLRPLPQEHEIPPDARATMEDARRMDLCAAGIRDWCILAGHQEALQRGWISMRDLVAGVRAVPLREAHRFVCELYQPTPWHERLRQLISA